MANPTNSLRIAVKTCATALACAGILWSTGNGDYIGRIASWIGRTLSTIKETVGYYANLATTRLLGNSVQTPIAERTINKIINSYDARNGQDIIPLNQDTVKALFDGCIIKNLPNDGILIDAESNGSFIALGTYLENIGLVKKAPKKRTATHQEGANSTTLTTTIQATITETKTISFNGAQPVLLSTDQTTVQQPGNLEDLELTRLASSDSQKLKKTKDPHHEGRQRALENRIRKQQQAHYRRTHRVRESMKFHNWSQSSNP